MSTYKNIPTSIISGFLGAGKTTAIQFLLKHKPQNEAWAVIVNEFGQVGIDGALLENKGAVIKEIAGGCLCCVGSQSFSVGLNQIIRSVKPQRILIEPTGLGHPAKLVASLSSEFYRSVLSLKAIINLLDARQLKDERYINNETFIDQSNMADILLASKTDTYSEEDKTRFFDYAMTFNPGKSKVAMIEQGQLLLEWLDLPHLSQHLPAFPESHEHHHANEACNIANDQNWLMVDGHASGFFSTGWKINHRHIFNQQKLTQFIESLFDKGFIQRAKGVLCTDKGWISINHAGNERKTQSVDASEYSEFEIIAENHLNSNELNVLLKETLI